MSVTRALTGTDTRALLHKHPDRFRLREIDDPIVQLLHVLHKLTYLTQLPMPSQFNACRRLIELYKRLLFHRHSNAYLMKEELLKLARGLSEPITLFERNLLEQQIYEKASGSSFGLAEAQVAKRQKGIQLSRIPRSSSCSGPLPSSASDQNTARSHRQTTLNSYRHRVECRAGSANSSSSLIREALLEHDAALLELDTKASAEFDVDADSRFATLTYEHLSAMMDRLLEEHAAACPSPSAFTYPDS